MRGPSSVLLLLAGLCLGQPAGVAAQGGGSASREAARPGFGAFVGLVSERTKLNNARADALEEESARIGLLVGRWSVAYSVKALSRSFLVSNAGDDLESARLELQGVEVGRLLSDRWVVQPTAYLTIARATVQRDVLTGMLVRTQSDRGSVTLLEPALSLGVPLWRVARAEVRVGTRLGPSATFEAPARDVDTAGPFVSATMSVGWFGDWSLRWKR